MLKTLKPLSKFGEKIAFHYKYINVISKNIFKNKFVE
jgi:hypothetical protein